VQWFAPFLAGGGYASEAIAFVDALDTQRALRLTMYAPRVSTEFCTRRCMDPTPARLKLEHVCAQWHPSRVVSFLPFETANHVTTLKAWCSGFDRKFALHSRSAIGIRRCWG
jgi:hypothetical protein